MIGLIDYGMGNLHSVSSACRALGLEVLISDDPAVLETCDKLILPGVGAFGDMDERLRQTGLKDWIQKAVREEHKPLLGICLGMQALFEKSFEFGEYEGLGFMQGEIVAMEPLTVHEKGKTLRLSVPQIGWNRLIFSGNFELAEELSRDPYVYFDHTYVLTGWDPADLVAYASYGPYTVPALLVKGCVAGAQFHPEKSGTEGLRILEWFGKEFCA